MFTSIYVVSILSCSAVQMVYYGTNKIEKVRRFCFVSSGPYSDNLQINIIKYHKSFEGDSVNFSLYVPEK